MKARGRNPLLSFSNGRAKKLPLCNFNFGSRNWKDLSVAASVFHFSNRQCGVLRMLSFKKPKLYENTTPFTNIQLCTSNNDIKENKNRLFTWSFCSQLRKGLSGCDGRKVAKVLCLNVQSVKVLTVQR